MRMHLVNRVPLKKKCSVEGSHLRDLPPEYMLNSFHYIRNYYLPLKLNPLHGVGGDANAISVQPTISEESSKFKRNFVWLSCHKTSFPVYSIYTCTLLINV